MARYLGVDLHRNNFTVCTIAENGRRYFREYGLHSLKYFVGQLRPTDQVAVEVSTTTSSHRPPPCESASRDPSGEKVALVAPG